MVKKFVIVIVCLVAVCSVLNLPDRLTYDGIKYAIESVQESSDTIKEDLLYVEIFSFVLDNFNPVAETQLSVEDIDGEWNIVYTKQVLYDDPVPEGYPRSNLTVKYFPIGTGNDAYAFAQDIVGTAKPLTWGVGNANGVFADVLAGVNTVAYFLGCVVSIVLFLCAILFDIVGVAWSVVRSAFYLVGLSPTA